LHSGKKTKLAGITFSKNAWANNGYNTLKTLRLLKHQTPGKIMGTENDTCTMGSHVTIVAVPEQRCT
jgi:hypothetical protein